MNEENPGMEVEDLPARDDLPVDPDIFAGEEVEPDYYDEDEV